MGPPIGACSLRMHGHGVSRHVEAEAVDCLVEHEAEGEPPAKHSRQDTEKTFQAVILFEC